MLDVTRVAAQRGASRRHWMLRLKITRCERVHRNQPRKAATTQKIRRKKPQKSPENQSGFRPKLGPNPAENWAQPSCKLDPELGQTALCPAQNRAQPSSRTGPQLAQVLGQLRASPQAQYGGLRASCPA